MTLRPLFLAAISTVLMTALLIPGQVNAGADFAAAFKKIKTL